MPTNRITKLPICSDQEVSACTLAALEVAGRGFAKVRDDLPPGDYKVWDKLLIHGNIKIGESVQAATPASYLDVLAWVLARLPANQQAAVADAVRKGIEPTKQQKDFAKAVCEPTRGTTIRRGSLTGIIDIVGIE